jgi:hypothetical protein
MNFKHFKTLKNHKNSKRKKLFNFINHKVNPISCEALS